MIAATVTVTTTSTSLFDLIEAATPDQLNNFSTGRVAEVHIQWLSGNFHLVYKTGTTVPTATIDLATDSGFEFADPSLAGNAAKGLLVIRGSAGMNVISLKDIYLVIPNAGAGSGRITAYTI